METVARQPGPIRDLAREIPGEQGSGPRAMTFGFSPARLVADFRASAMGFKPKSPGSVATVSRNGRFLAILALRKFYKTRGFAYGGRPHTVEVAGSNPASPIGLTAIPGWFLQLSFQESAEHPHGEPRPSHEGLHAARAESLVQHAVQVVVHGHSPASVSSSPKPRSSGLSSHAGRLAIHRQS